MIIGIETSCDETAAAVVSREGTLRANIVLSQQDVHARFGGVVPELAGRRHIETLDQVVREALHVAELGPRDLTAVAVTSGPGLIGALLVGVAYAKGLAYALGIPVVAVNHLEGHLSAASFCPRPLAPPFVALIASGGHTSLYHVKSWKEPELLGRTLDDAAGEAFDKAAKMLGLGYPGGPAIDKLAKTGDAQRVQLPMPYPNLKDLNFSFSGLKTALLYFLRDQHKAAQHYDVADVAAAYQRAIVTVLVDKTIMAAQQVGARDILVTGGVAANSELRARFAVKMPTGMHVHIPPFPYCTDNAAMIARAGLRLWEGGYAGSLAFEPQASWNLGELGPQ